jgi:hypothetical protein
MNKYLSSILRFLFIALLYENYFSAFSQILTQDLNFGKSGIVKENFFKNTTMSGESMLCSKNGDIKIFGGTRIVNGDVQMCAMAFHQSGKLDSSFGSNGKMLYPSLNNSSGKSSCLKAISAIDGGYYLAGYSFLVDNNVDAAVLKIKPNGLPDSAWGNNGWCLAGFGSNEYAFGIAEFADHSLTIVYRMYNAVGKDSGAVFRIKPNGTVDSAVGYHSHNSFPIGINFYVMDAVMDTQNTIYVVGATYTNIYEPVFARILKDGRMDTSFNHTGFLPFASVEGALNHVVVDQFHRPVATGYTTFQKKTDVVVYRLLPTGLPDIDFSPNGRKDLRINEQTNIGNCVLAVDSGNLYILGKSFNPAATLYETFVIKVSHTGYATPVITGKGIWMKQISPRDDAASALGIDKWGRLFIGGTYFEYNNSAYFMLLRLGENWPTAVQKTRQPAIAIFPNPNKGSFNVSGLPVKTENASLCVYNLQHQLVYTQTLNTETELHLNLENRLGAGLYLLQLQKSDEIWNARFEIEP